jgi:hypothetical protein
MMMKKILLSMILYIMVGVLAAFGADRNWTNAGGDRLWRNGANWDTGLPVAAEKAAIRNNFFINGPIIDSVTTAMTKELVIGDWSSASDSVEMTGGSLSAAAWLILGYGFSNNGTLTFTDGTANIGEDLYVGYSGRGTLSISGGSITVKGRFGIAQNAGSTGKVFLDGGTISAGSFNMTTGGTLDITGGTLIVNGDITLAVAGYVNALQIIAYDGTGTVYYDYNTTNSNKTTVWANPASVIGDVDGDGNVDVADLILLAAEWLQPNPNPDADFTQDGKVNMPDFQAFATNWLYNQYSKTLTGKIMCGYQGWFNCPGDSANRGWVHWGRSNKFEPGYCTVDWWPDMSQYDADEKFATGFKNADNSTAYVFSSHKEKTVLRHFSWMADYGIDGVFLQRFATEIEPASLGLNHCDKVLRNCQKGAKLHKRAWAMMYDLSSSYTGPALKERVIRDWKHLVDTYQITKDPADAAYLHHKGKPVVAVWGLGFGRTYEGRDTYDIIDFLKNDPVYGGCTIMIGVGNDWRTNSTPWFQQIVVLADIISPWAVGRYGSKNTSELDIFTTNNTVPDQAWCNSNGKDYLPVVYPGFSWQNLQQNNRFDEIPRLGGSFLWRQYYNAIHDAGATMIYQAMFDEVDEGTAIFKCTSTPPIAERPTSVFSNTFLPTGNAQFAPYRPSDALLPSDHYLWLVGQGTKMLRRQIPLSATMPTR